MNSVRRYLMVPLVLGTLVCITNIAHAEGGGLTYKQTNLVSDGAVSATTTDMQLKNAWGIAAFPGGPFWIADNATGLSTLYDGHGDKIPLTVTIPPPMGSPPGTLAAPTGVVFNPTPSSFLVQQTPALTALFIFATEDGTISAWNPTLNLKNAVLEVDNSDGGTGAVYKGLALATNSTGVFLYATNFRAGTVDVFDSKFKPAQLSGSFQDPDLPRGYAPFGIALIDGNLYVTYALQDAAKHDDQAAPGRGYVDVFDTDGHFVKRFASRGTLNSPWGIARAPLNFGPYSTRILIGNFGDGRISGFTSTGEFFGQLLNTTGHTVRIPGLWGIQFGIEAGADTNKLYFTAGPNGESDGLFGSLESVP